MFTRKIPAGLAATLLACACPLALAQTDASALMPLLYDAASREAPAVAQKVTCAIAVAPTADDRQNKQTIGTSMAGPLLTGDASPWVTDGLMHLKDYGFTVNRAEAAAVPAGGLLVKTRLTRAYTWQIGLKIFSMVAVKAQFINQEGVLQEKYYRAHGDKTNMWGAASEYVTTLNYGANNLLRAVAEDLSFLCKGQKVEAYTYAGPDAKPARQ